MSKNKNNKAIWSTRIKKNTTSTFKKVGSSIDIDKRLFRPNEVNFLKGNNMKAKKILKWTPKINYIKLVKEMVASDLENLSS